MALGATPSLIVRLVLGESVRLIGGGILTGALAAAGLTRLVADLLFGLSPLDPLTYAGVSLLLLGVAMLACVLPARRAAKVDPMVALRCE